jgi:hypothetical protein
MFDDKAFSSVQLNIRSFIFYTTTDGGSIWGNFDSIISRFSDSMMDRDCQLSLPRVMTCGFVRLNREFGTGASGESLTVDAIDLSGDCTEHYGDGIGGSERCFQPEVE